MGEKIDVKSLVKKRKKELKQQIDTLKIFGIKPKLAVILASDDEASKVYQVIFCLFACIAGTVELSLAWAIAGKNASGAFLPLPAHCLPRRSAGW